MRFYVVFWTFWFGFDGLGRGTVPCKWLCYAGLSEVWSVIFGGFVMDFWCGLSMDFCWAIRGEGRVSDGGLLRPAGTAKQRIF